VASEAPLRDTVIALGERPRVFVTSLGAVGGIITRADLQKPPVRMWLFGLITLVEQALGMLIRARYPDGSWAERLSPSRLQRAERFQAERELRNSLAHAHDIVSGSLQTIVRLSIRSDQVLGLYESSVSADGPS
jgi:hypothetical protein